MIGLAGESLGLLSGELENASLCNTAYYALVRSIGTAPSKRLLRFAYMVPGRPNQAVLSCPAQAPSSGVTTLPPDLDILSISSILNVRHHSIFSNQEHVSEVIGHHTGQNLPPQELPAGLLHACASGRDCDGNGRDLVLRP